VLCMYVRDLTVLILRSESSYVSYWFGACWPSILDW
jgi:hypothetical protein